MACTLGACLRGSLAVSPCGAASRTTFVFQADTLSSSAVSIFTYRHSTWSLCLRFRNKSYTHCQDCSIETACRAPTARRTRYRQEVVSQRQAQNEGFLARFCSRLPSWTRDLSSPSSRTATSPPYTSRPPRDQLTSLMKASPTPMRKTFGLRRSQLQESKGSTAHASCSDGQGSSRTREPS